MKRHMGSKFGVVWLILSLIILTPVLVPAKEKGKFKKDIIVTCPEPNQCVSSPLTVKGKARGSWYFEASFPMRLQDAQGNELAVGNGKASGDWMTENFVPFEGTLEFTVTKQTKGKLILENDNPSGLPENAKKIEIPVILVPKKP
jgi:hypothetical protein